MLFFLQIFNVCVRFQVVNALPLKNCDTLPHPPNTSSSLTICFKRWQSSASCFGPKCQMLQNLCWKQTQLQIQCLQIWALSSVSMYHSERIKLYNDKCPGIFELTWYLTTHILYSLSMCVCVCAFCASCSTTSSTDPPSPSASANACCVPLPVGVGHDDSWPAE